MAGSARGRQQLPLTQNRTADAVQPRQSWDDSCLCQMALASTGLVLWRDCLSTLKIVFHGQCSLPGFAPLSQLLQLKCQSLYSENAIANLTLLWTQVMVTRTAKVINWYQLSILPDYSSHFGEKAQYL